MVGPMALPILDDKPMLFSRHALVRMSQRRVGPNEVFVAIAGLESGREGTQIFERQCGASKMRVVVEETRHQRNIVTVMFDGEDGCRQ